MHADAFTPGRRVLVIDLGLPRNVDPAVGRVAGVELLDLETIRLHAPLEEFSAHADARAIVGDAATEFAADRAAGPAITALRQEVLDVVEAEIARARARGAGDDIEAALRHLAGVLLHRPSVRIRELAVEGRIDEVHAALETLHGLGVRRDRRPRSPGPRPRSGGCRSGPAARSELFRLTLALCQGRTWSPTCTPSESSPRSGA